ncbi:MarR family transcriptional regulator [Streptomyces populi]|uniref:MarR family transcriptional regulator n=1 Tax=Streptomyces populi TaxID=2058924 RepID=A0A2I0SWU7_9ACTN|nr:MarR family transcriptional regulator [Streptomyces populi]
MGTTADDRLGTDTKRAEQALVAARSSAPKDAGLTVARYVALFILTGSPGVSGAALDRSCLVAPQAMAAVLKTLEERGPVAGSAHPWHRKMLETHLTDTGRRAVRLADAQAVRIERRLAEEFTPQERDTPRRLPARCVTAVREDRNPRPARPAAPEGRSHGDRSG